MSRIENKKTLLLVEDDFILAKAEKMSLEQYGYSVLTSSSGEKAITAVQQNPRIDLILMDVDLGSGMDGTQAAEKILNHHDIPIVFLSSHTEPEIVEKTEKITSYGYVVKNSTITVLDASIKMAFKLFDANKKITESEMKQKTMISNISDAIGIITLEGILKYMSPNVEKWFGWKPEDLVGQNVLSQIRPAEIETLTKTFYSLFEKENSHQTLELPFLCKDGSFKPVKLSAVNLTHDPAIGGVLFNFHDITERKNAEDKIQKIGKHYQSIIEKAPDGIALLDENGKFKFASQSARKMFGYPLSGDIIDNPTELTHPEDLPMVDENLKKLMETPSYAPTLQYRCRHQNGEWKWIESTFTNLLSDPSVEAIVINFHDISRFKEAEKSLQQSQEQFRGIVETSLEGIVSISLFQKVIYANKRMAKMLGYTVEELIGQSVNSFIFPEDWEDHLNRVNNRIDGKGELYERRLRRKDGTSIWVIISAALMSHPYEQSIAMCTDITERKKVEETLRITKNKCQKLFEILPVGVSLLDSNHKIIDFNPRLGKILDISQEGLKNESYKNRIYLRSDGRVLSEDEMPSNIALKEQRIVKNAEVGVVKENGAIIWVNVTAAPLPSPENGCVIVTTDITEPKQTKDALEQSEHQLHIIADNIPAIISYVNAKTLRYRFVNRFFADSFGVDQQKVIGMQVKEILGEQAFQRAENYIQQAQKGERVTYENIVPIHGKLRWFNISYIPEFDHQGCVKNLIVMAFDINDIKQANETIQTLLNEKEILLKEVHHRIKNHMNTISSLLMLQAETAKEPSTIAALQDAGSRVQSMMLLYNKLYQSSNFQEISLKDYLPSLIDEIISNFPSKLPLMIEKKIDDFVLDVKRLHPLGIIINELITNSMKYAFIGKKDGFISVSVSLTGKRVSVIIQDNGNTIPESINFENSTGFGLMLVEMLTQQLNGEIRIERQNGTQFILEFDI